MCNGAHAPVHRLGLLMNSNTQEARGVNKAEETYAGDLSVWIVFYETP